MANTYLSRTISSTSTPKKMTCSFWIKRTGTGNSVQRIFSQSNNAPFDMYWRWETGDVFTAWNELNNGGTLNSISPNMKFRDFGAWYHIVLRWDTTQSTSTDRIRMYVNGTNIDDLGGYSSYTAPSLNDDIGIFSSTSNIFDIGYYRANGGETLESNLTHVHLCDGYSYGPESFGQTDSITGEWSIKPIPNVTYGTNGFFLFKDDASINDQSGNGNNFTLGSGNLNKTEDNPSNNFAILNTMRKVDTSGTFSKGNLTYTRGDNNWVTAISTLGFTKGKFYYEAEFESGSYFKLGFVSDDSVTGVGHIGQAAIDAGYAWYMNSGGEVRTDDAVVSGWAGSDITNISTITTGDIMKVAVDMDNKFAYFGVNNVWAKNADPTSGSSGTGGFPISSEYTSGQEQKIMLPAVSVYNASCHVNFGNGYFGTTAVSSAGTNASTHGVFEYDVPAGYTAVCTKGINSF